MKDIDRLIGKDGEKYMSKVDPRTIRQNKKYVNDRLIHYGQSHTARAYESYRDIQEFK